MISGPVGFRLALCPPSPIPSWTRSCVSCDGALLGRLLEDGERLWRLPRRTVENAAAVDISYNSFPPVWRRSVARGEWHPDPVPCPARRPLNRGVWGMKGAPRYRTARLSRCGREATARGEAVRRIHMGRLIKEPDPRLAG